MPRQQKGLNAALTVVQQGAQGGRHQLVQGKHAEVPYLALTRRKQSGRHGGGCGFKADAQKDHRALRIGRGHVEGVQRGVDDFYPRALGLGVLETFAAGAGHAQQISESGQDDSVTPGQVQKGGHFRVVGNADGTARSGKVRDRCGQQRTQAALENGHRMCAANLHKA